MKYPILRKLLWLIFAGIAWDPVHARWVAVGFEWHAGATLYIDPASQHKEGQLRRFWTMADRKQQRLDGEMSRRELLEIDCQEKSVRRLLIHIYSAPMGEGRLLRAGQDLG